MKLYCLILNNFKDGMEREDVCNMESIQMRDGSTQQYGYVVYETTVTKGSKLMVEHARDYVFVS